VSNSLGEAIKSRNDGKLVDPKVLVLDRTWPGPSLCDWGKDGGVVDD